MPLTTNRRDTIHDLLRTEDGLTAALVRDDGMADGAAGTTPAASPEEAGAASRDPAFTPPDASEPLPGFEPGDRFAVGVLDEDPAPAEPAGALAAQEGFVDLVITSFDATPEPATIGGTVTVTFNVGNAGTADTSGFDVDIFLSTDSFIETSDTALGSVFLGELGAGDSTTVTRTVTLPAPTDPIWAEDTDGVFGIGAIATNADGTPEDPAGNRAVDTVVIEEADAAGPDLVGTSFNVVREPLAKGDLFQVDFTVANEGTGSAVRFDVDFRLSTNDIISTFDFDLGERTQVRLAAGQSVTLNSIFELPDRSDPFWSGDSDGRFAIGARIDSGNDVLESDEANNSNRGNLIDFDVLNIV